MRDSANASTPRPTANIGVGRITPLVSIEAPGACGSHGSNGESRCGSADALARMPPQVWEKIKTHPCYSEDAHRYYARMHVAVAPACNIQCNYCNRKYDCSNESRPGVASQKLTPEQAVKKVIAVASRIPQLTVLGIAGPGDSLANPKATFDTFRLLNERAPDIKLCLSTNGLALPDFVDEICRYKIDHVTITINMVDPVVGEKIYPWIFWRNRRVTGIDAARILHERQMQGLEMLSERGVLTKINSVLIPGVNEEHLILVNQEVKRRGAFLHNIMPLICDPVHGTYFGIHGQRAPTAQELKAVQDACTGGTTLMRHCRQCRADAVGLLGEDRGGEFTLDRIETMEIEYLADSHREYMNRIEVERNVQLEARREALFLAPENDVENDIKVLVAVATTGGGRVNAHFGNVSEFQIFEVSGTQVLFVGHRRVDHYCQDGYGDDEELASLLCAINDCHAVLVAKVGACPRKELSRAGIEPIDQYAGENIERAALSWYTEYRGRIANGAVAHKNRGDAAIRQPP
ncbi:nitrogenase cofactor biosynthesis protein NifB [Cupriavidus consociatus]|uniref:nitrogenase cofactor biosynthesis protein NifB n=1 Tax=Cupriavidus consociatus TaxID=2821357 RepID=UPI001AE3D94E|nr:MULTISPECIES: nitrogenase cofactor biosynthesis protein NifB [unclassified Cupriavidus]MBP0625264.1 nitrogenase cofactor biosynthesis protein NifB [Cupriavidus sp. LEh25]MDK2661998.1 nitrogenase cofactor biosynthesis protein NifB [Cupriavidus sp. LEh21]